MVEAGLRVLREEFLALVTTCLADSKVQSLVDLAEVFNQVIKSEKVLSLL
jgi:hypothetical protein